MSTTGSRSLQELVGRADVPLIGVKGIPTTRLPIDLLDCAVVLYDPATLQVTSSNTAARAQSGYTTGELGTMSLFELIPAFERPPLRRGLAAVLDGAVEVVDVETEQSCADGRLWPIRARIARARDGRRNVLAVITTDASGAPGFGAAPGMAGRDAEATGQITCDAVLTFGADGVVQGCSAGAERLFGWGAEEVVGQKVTSLLAPGSKRAFTISSRKHSGRAERPRADRRRQIEGLHREGHRLRLEMSLTEVRSAGEALYVAGFAEIGPGS